MMYVLGYLFIGVIAILKVQDTGLDKRLIEGMKVLFIFFVIVILWPIMLLVVYYLDKIDTEKEANDFINDLIKKKEGK